jgi:hypothetical protein
MISKTRSSISFSIKWERKDDDLCDYKRISLDLWSKISDFYGCASTHFTGLFYEIWIAIFLLVLIFTARVSVSLVLDIILLLVLSSC